MSRTDQAISKGQGAGAMGGVCQHSRLKCTMLSPLSNIIAQTHRRQVTAGTLEIGRHWNEPKWRHARSPTGKASKTRRRVQPSWYFHLSAICVRLISEPSRLLVLRTANLTPRWICILIAYHTRMRMRMCMPVCVHVCAGNPRHARPSIL